MSPEHFLRLLNDIDFPRQYWQLCDEFPGVISYRVYRGRRPDIERAFREAGVEPLFDARDRSFMIEVEVIRGWTWDGVFCIHRNGASELLIGGRCDCATLGSNFAVLAYNAHRLADPTFERDRFSGPPPYPRPSHDGDPAALTEIIRRFVSLVRQVKDRVRSEAI